MSFFLRAPWFVQRKENDGGLQFIEWNGRLYRYKTCHFGGSWSAWWWSRVAAATMRILHELVGESHAAFVYVDDYLILTPRSRIDFISALVQVLFSALNVPLSWHKVSSGPQVPFLGFQVDAASATIGLPADKLDKVLSFLDLRKGNRLAVREIERGRGRLLWDSCLCLEIPPLFPS